MMKCFEILLLLTERVLLRKKSKGPVIVNYLYYHHIMSYIIPYVCITTIRRMIYICIYLHYYFVPLIIITIL